MGKESKKKWIYVYVKLNHFAVHLKLTQHCTILQYKIKIKLKKESITNKLFLNIFFKVYKELINCIHVSQNLLNTY